MLTGQTVKVIRSVQTGTDDMGEPIYDTTTEEVDNVLFSPSSTDDLSGQHPQGDTISVTFHMPKTYTSNLRGCKIGYANETYSVVGDPKPYMVENCPPHCNWNRAVTAEVVYG